MKKRTMSQTWVAAGVLLLVGCQDLTVPNYNNPSIDEAKSNATNIEAQNGTAFKYLFTVMQGSDIRNGTTFYPSAAQSCMGNEMSPGTSNLGNNQDVCLEPRIEFNNFDQGQWTNRTPYQMIYGGIASANDVLSAISAGLKIGLPSSDRPQGIHTDRNVWWATFMIGLGNTYLGLLLDQAIVVEPGVPYDVKASNPRPYPEVLAAGMQQLRSAIDLATKAPSDTTPLTWVNQNAISRDDAVRVMHSFIARSMVYGARTPTERAKIDWAAVIKELDAGIVKDFTQLADNTNRGTMSYYKQWVQLQTDARPSIRLYGPADTTGQYQGWLAKPVEQRVAITIASPDKRISNADLTKNGGVATGGAYFQFNSQQTMPTTLGTYYLSSYRSVKFGVGTANNYWQTGNLVLMAVSEMQLLRAEALIRLGRAAEAVTIINATRVANGKLPPVDVSGPPQGNAAEIASCVPKRDNGACGDLMDALMYESRFENFGVEGTIAWANARGWGKLLSGTLIHFPIPGRDLQVLGIPYYTFGGPNSHGSAP
ncbi:MAG: RagB/SusD family nutrient uptake outer membrane protein [bacterium]